MPDKFASINKVLGTETDMVEVESQSVSTTSEDIEKDYQYTRANLYSLIEKGQESLNGIMELAGESASPRAYEVAGQIIKSCLLYTSPSPRDRG